MRPPRVLAIVLLAATALAACGSNAAETGTTAGTAPSLDQSSGNTTGGTSGVPVEVPSIDVGPSDDPAVLTSNRAAWDAVRPDAYVFIYESLCFCPATATRITVSHGEVTAVSPAAAGQNLGSLELAEAPTMEDVFDQAADELDNAEKVAITYDGERGFPTVVDADRVVNAIDDELTIKVSGFEPLD